MFNQVVVVPHAGQSGQVGFTSGRPLPGDPDNLCVFVPNLPNPLSGRLVLARRETCIVLPISVDEAFKFLLSTGNYLPPSLRGFGPLMPDSDRLPLTFRGNRVRVTPPFRVLCARHLHNTELRTRRSECLTPKNPFPGFWVPCSAVGPPGG
jgi:hypothetical protein